MQVGKNNNNRFRKLIPSNNRQINPTTAQIYSSQYKPRSGSQSKIQTMHSNSYKNNFRSLQRQSGQDLKSLRERQLVERRLRTISAAAYEGQKQNYEFNDNNLKRSSDNLIRGQIQGAKKSKLNQLMDLIVQFKLKTDSIINYQEQLVQNQNQTKGEHKVDEIIFQEQVYELIRKTRESSINLMSIYINRVIRQIKQDALNSLAEIEAQEVKEVESDEQMKYQTDSYLVSNIAFQKDKVKDRRKTKERGNLMNVNKFFDRK